MCFLYENIYAYWWPGLTPVVSIICHHIVKISTIQRSQIIKRNILIYHCDGRFIICGYFLWQVQYLKYHNLHGINYTSKDVLIPDKAVASTEQITKIIFLVKIKDFNNGIKKRLNLYNIWYTGTRIYEYQFNELLKPSLRIFLIIITYSQT